MRKYKLLTWLIVMALILGLMPASAVQAQAAQAKAARHWAAPAKSLASNQDTAVKKPEDLSTIVLDGVRDAGYIKIATDPASDLGPCCWNGINWTDLTNLYVAADASNLYVYVDSPAYDYNVSAGQIGLALDVDGKPNSGGVSDPWNNAIAFAYNTVDGAATPAKVLPDYVIRGSVINNLSGGDAGNGWTELRHWDGSSWTGSGTNWGGITGSNLIGTHVAYSNTQGLEFAIPLADIGNPDPANVHLEFFTTQGGGTKGAYDTLPSDDQATGWDDATTENNLASVPVAIDPANDSVPGNAWSGVAWTDMTRLHIWADHNNLHLFLPASAYSQTVSTGQIGLAIDTKPGGGSGDPWGNGITYAYTTTWQNLGHAPVVTTSTILPDYMIRGNIFNTLTNSDASNGWVEFRTWNGSDWNTGSGSDWGGIGNTGQPSIPGSHVAWSNGDGLRLTIPINQLNVSAGNTINLEFFGTQGGSSKGAYDTVPSDDQATDWNIPTMQKILASYTIPNIPLPQASHDGTVWTDGLYHDTRNSLYRNPFGAATVGTPVALRFRAYHNDLTGVRVRMSDNVSGTVTSYPMNLVANDGTYDYYEYDLPTDHATLLWYTFEAMDTPALVYYGDDLNWSNAPWTKDGTGVHSTDPTQVASFQLTVYLPDYTTPDWLKNGVIYQIFPDRFRNGNSANDVISGTFFYDGGSDGAWGTAPYTHTGDIAHTTWNEQIYDPRTDPTYLNAYSNQFYGGDLKGITDMITANYFDDLGVTVLYLNPIFKSPSNHKYDTTDYTQIDPAFGTNADFAALTAAAHAHGINIILDGVFNHSSSDSIYFDKYSRWDSSGLSTTLGLNDGSGAFESQSSPYYSWYTFNPWPAGYTAWAGYTTLPKLNSSNPLVRSYIYSSTTPIATRWIVSGSETLANGWRFDVANEIDPGYANAPANGYWIGFRDAVRSAYSQTAMISEIWDNASAYLLGNQMDSTMNYRFRNALLGFIRDTGWTDTNTTFPHETPSEFFQTMQSLQEDYPAPAWYAMMNLVDSHDTNRLRFVIKESTDVTTTVDARQKLTALAQFTLPGAPTVYYADEVGASADGVACGNGTCGDPYNRLPFPWPDTPGYYKQEPDILPRYARLGLARQLNPALRTGSLDLLKADDANQVLAYGRREGPNVAVTVFNRSTSQQQIVLDLFGYLPAGTVVTDVLSTPVQVYTLTAVGASVPLTLTVNGNDGVLLTAHGVSALPDAPTNLVAAEGDAQVALTWDAVGSATYNVYRSLLSGGGYTRIATDTVGTAYTDTTATNGTLYYYVVTALGGGLQESADSNEVSALPHAPIGWVGSLAPAAIVQTVGLTSTDPITAEVYVAGVTGSGTQGPGIIGEVGYGISGTAPAGWSLWSPMSYAAPSGSDDAYTATLTPEMTGTFQYLARFSTTNGRDWTYAGLSGPVVTPTLPTPDAGILTVNASSDTTPPDAPTNLTLASWSVDYLALGWTAPAAADVYAYDLHRLSATQPDAVVARIMSPTLVYTDYNVTTNTTYTYTVVALDTSFNPSLPSNSVAGTPQQRFVTVTFNVTIPTFTPAGSTICIPGDNATIMGSQWSAGTLPMTQVDATHWTETIPNVQDGLHLQYKYTRCNSWNVVEWWGAIVGTANRQLDINYGTNGNQVVNDAVGNWRDPLVVDQGPLPGATNVSPSAVVTATWNRPLLGSSVPGSFSLASTGGPVVGSAGYISQTNFYETVFTPTSALAPSTVYTPTLGTGIQGTDNDGATVQQPIVWNFTTLTVYGVQLAPSTATLSGNPGEVVTYTLALTNTGSATDVFTVTLAGNSWTTTAPATVGPLAPNASTALTVAVTIPANVVGGASDVVTATVTSQGDAVQSAASTLTTTANPVYGMQLVPSTAALSGNPSEVVTYTLFLTNTGNAADVFTVTLAGNSWTTTAPATVGPLAPNVSTALTVAVTIPANAVGGATDVVTATVTSQSDAAQSAASTLTTTANPVYGVQLAPSTAALSRNPGEVVSYTLFLTNTGNAADVFTVTLAGNSWTTTAPATVGPLAAHASTSLAVTVTIPANAVGGATDVVTATVTSQSDAAQSAASTLTTTANPVYGMQLVPSTAALSRNPGEVVSYTLFLTNTGNAADVFTVTLAGNTWTTTAPATVGPLAAHASTSLAVAVTIPANAVGGATDVVMATVTSQGDAAQSAASTLTTTANNVYQLSLTPSTDHKTNYVGKTVGYTLTLQNNGNAAAVFVLSYAGNLWSVSMPVSVTLAAGAQTDFAVQVSIPLTATHLATDTVTISAWPQSSPSSTASAVLTTTANRYLINLPLVLQNH